MTPKVLYCHQCGNPMSVGRKKPCIVRGDFKLANPVFCSTKCAHVYNASNLTLAKILGLCGQMSALTQM